MYLLNGGRDDSRRVLKGDRVLMIITQLQEYLLDRSVPQYSYCINQGHCHEAHCINAVETGFEVYFGERNYKVKRKTFDRESDAVEYFLQCIKGERLLKRFFETGNK